MSGIPGNEPARHAPPPRWAFGVLTVFVAMGLALMIFSAVVGDPRWWRAGLWPFAVAIVNLVVLLRLRHLARRTGHR